MPPRRTAPLTPIPLVDLYAQYLTIKGEIDRAISCVIEESSFILGRHVEEFERQFAAYCGAKYCVALNSGTSALHLALLGVGVGPGSEVITVPNTFVATVEAIQMAGARAVFVDVDPETSTMNPGLLERSITGATRAIVPVHLYGQPAAMGPIREIARRHGLSVIEDACQAHGARYKGKPVGTLGDAGCFSFYPGKNLGAYGEGGCIVTNRKDIAEKARILRDHGQTRKHAHRMKGFNYRMEGLQGAVLGVKLKHLDRWNAQRARAAELYDRFLTSPRIKKPSRADQTTHVYHLYVIRTPFRNELMQRLKAHKIATAVHYPVPIHLQAAYKDLGYARGDFPVAEYLASRILSLPLYPELSETQIETVARTLEKELERILSARKRTSG